MRNVYHIKNMFTISDTQLQNKHINSQPIDPSILSCLSKVLNSGRLLQERYFLMKNRSCDSAFGQLFDISGQCIPPHARARPWRSPWSRCRHYVQVQPPSHLMLHRSPQSSKAVRRYHSLQTTNVECHSYPA